MNMMLTRAEKRRQWIALSEDGWSYRKIAAAFGVNVSTVSRVIRDVTEPRVPRLTPQQVPRLHKPRPSSGPVRRLPWTDYALNTTARYEGTAQIDLRVGVLAAAGFTQTEAAWLLSSSRSAMARAAGRLGIRWPAMGAGPDAVPDRPAPARDAALTEAVVAAAEKGRDLYEIVGDMKPAAALDHLIWLLGELLHDAQSQSLSPYPGLNLRSAEARLVYALFRRRGRAVSRANLLAMAYAEVPEAEWPAEKIIDIMVCTVRQKLVAAEVPARIETSWGTGYALHVEDGVFDWSNP